jgi:hypothetical protein
VTAYEPAAASIDHLERLIRKRDLLQSAIDGTVWQIVATVQREKRHLGIERWAVAVLSPGADRVAVEAELIRRFQPSANVRGK